MFRKSIKFLREAWATRVIYSGIGNLLCGLTIIEKNVLKGEYRYDDGSIWEVTVKKIK